MVKDTGILSSIVYGPVSSVSIALATGKSISNPLWQTRFIAWPLGFSMPSELLWSSVFWGTLGLHENLSGAPRHSITSPSRSYCVWSGSTEEWDGKKQVCKHSSQSHCPPLAFFALRPWDRRKDDCKRRPAGVTSSYMRDMRRKVFPTRKLPWQDQTPALLTSAHRAHLDRWHVRIPSSNGLAGQDGSF